MKGKQKKKKLYHTIYEVRRGNDLKYNNNKLYTPLWCVSYQSQFLVSVNLFYNINRWYIVKKLIL